MATGYKSAEGSLARRRRRDVALPRTAGRAEVGPRSQYCQRRDEDIATKVRTGSGRTVLSIKFRRLLGGQALYRLASIALAAKQVGDKELTRKHGLKLKKALRPWLASSEDSLLVYDASHGGVVTRAGYKDAHADFGNGKYNDHHFHYGASSGVPSSARRPHAIDARRLPRPCFCRVAERHLHSKRKVLSVTWTLQRAAKLRATCPWRRGVRTFGARDGNQPVSQVISASGERPKLARGIRRLGEQHLAQTSRDPELKHKLNFDFHTVSRHKDWYDGHSWASGLFSLQNGKSQESISEAAHSYYGAALWGSVTGDPELRDFARLALALEVRSGRHYWRVSDDEGVYKGMRPFSSDTSDRRRRGCARCRAGRGSAKPRRMPC